MPNEFGFYARTCLGASSSFYAKWRNTNTNTNAMCILSASKQSNYVYIVIDTRDSIVQTQRNSHRVLRVCRFN